MLAPLELSAVAAVVQLMTTPLPILSDSTDSKCFLNTFNEAEKGEREKKTAEDKIEEKGEKGIECDKDVIKIGIYSP